MDKKGFTLVEVTIALFVFMVVLVGLAGYVSTSMKASSQSKQTSVASSMIQDKMEALRNIPYAFLASGNDAVIAQGLTYQRQWTISQSGNIKTVDITVSYSGKNMQAATVRGE